MKKTKTILFDIFAIVIAISLVIINIAIAVIPIAVSVYTGNYYFLLCLILSLPLAGVQLFALKNLNKNR